MKKHEFVAKNISVVKKLFKSGDLSSKIMDDYRIYNVWLSNKGIKGKMEQYRETAIDQNVSVRTVIRAVKNMLSPIR